MGGRESFGDFTLGLDRSGVRFDTGSYFHHALEEVRQLTYGARTQRAEVTELHNLKYSTGKHNTPDAMVYVPAGFDPNKPIRVMVYNHGLGTDAKSAFNNSKLKEQMAAGDPNTILIVPEWQKHPGTRQSGDSDPFHKPDFFKNMLNEIMTKTPALHGKDVKDIASVGIITHSGGFKPAMSEIYKNGLYDKVNSLSVLDSMYNPSGYDRWVSDNIRDLASGKKHLLVVYTDHLSPHSNGLAARVEQMLRHNSISPAVVVRDGNHGQNVTPASVLRGNGIVFKYSNLKTAGQSAHSTMTDYYVREIVNSERSAV